MLRDLRLSLFPKQRKRAVPELTPLVTVVAASHWHGKGGGVQCGRRANGAAVHTSMLWGEWRWRLWKGEDPRGGGGEEDPMHSTRGGAAEPVLAEGEGKPYWSVGIKGDRTCTCRFDSLGCGKCDGKGSVR